MGGQARPERDDTAAELDLFRDQLDDRRRHAGEPALEVRRDNLDFARCRELAMPSRSRNGRSTPGNGEDLVGLGAARRVDFDRIADFLADQRAGDR